jgi:hypothetical protein
LSRARARLPCFALAAALLAGCSWYESVLSRTLRPVARDSALPLTLFRARVQMSTLEVWGRARHGDEDYRPGFERELDSLAALCAALARSELTFREEWRQANVQLSIEYGSQWRWRNTYGWTRFRIDRQGLLEAARAASPEAECRKRWDLVIVKVGPPDYELQELREAPPAQ